MIDEQSSASEHDYASDRSAIGAGSCLEWSFHNNVTMHRKKIKVIQLPGDDIDLKINFQIWVFCYFWQFSKKRRDTWFVYTCIYSFLGDVDQLSRDGLD